MAGKTKAPEQEHWVTAKRGGNRTHLLRGKWPAPGESVQVVCGEWVRPNSWPFELPETCLTCWEAR